MHWRTRTVRLPPKNSNKDPTSRLKDDLYDLYFYFNLKYYGAVVTVRTKISRSRFFEKQLERVPDFIQKKVILWVFLVESKGLAEVMKSPGFHDEPLKGIHQGKRSVRMNRAYRLIYRLIEDRIHIELLEVNKHDY